MPKGAVKYEVKDDVASRELEISRTDGMYRVVMDEREYFVDLEETEDGFYSLLIDGLSFEVGIEEDGDQYGVHFYNDTVLLQVQDLQRKKILEQMGKGGGGSDESVSSPMPGKIVRVLVEAGQAVESGQGVVVVEAMKMQNELKAPRAGTIAEITVSEGQTVDSGQVLVRIG